MSKYSRISSAKELDKALKSVRKDIAASEKRISEKCASFRSGFSPLTAVSNLFGQGTRFFSGLAVALSMFHKLRGGRRRV